VIFAILPSSQIHRLAEILKYFRGRALESSALADTVGADETKDLTGTGSGRRGAERVGGIAMVTWRIKICREVDDGNGLERASIGMIRSDRIPRTIM